MVFDQATGELRKFLRTAYNYDMDSASLETALVCDDETRTQQQFKEECDINTIVERFGITGELPQNVRVPLQEEFLETFDYQTSLNKLIEADEAFMQYPANVRAEFQNDAGKFVEYVSDPNPDDEKKAKLKKWGLLRPETARQEPIEVRVIPDPSAELKTPPAGV